MAELFVKACGLRDAANARAAIVAGASALGFVLAPSRRQVTVDDVAAIRDELFAELAELPPFVAVVVNPSPRELRSIEMSGVFDAVQFSGDEPMELVSSTQLRSIKALRLPADVDTDAVIQSAKSWMALDPAPIAMLVEGYAEGSYGGAGARADWDVVRRVADVTPVILAGGLTPNNVRIAVERARPHGVDVSSGIERDGQKSPDLIREFVARARGAEVSS